MSKEIVQIQKLIVKNFNLEPKSAPTEGDWEQLQAWLAREIQLIMDNDFQHFLNLLYRIDISEEKAKLAFTDDHPTARLAELIIERELQKAASRKKYK
jgi:hypothetical protein